MFKSAMIEKSEEGVLKAISRLEEISKGLVYKTPINMKESYRLKASLLLADCILRVIDLRKESRESDYLNLDVRMDKKIIVELNESINIYFE